MSGAGHVQDMNNRIRQNRAQRPSKRRKFKEHNRQNIYSSPKRKKQNLQFKSVSEEQLAEIKIQIRKRAKKDRKKEWSVFVALLFLVLVITLLFFWWV